MTTRRDNLRNVQQRVHQTHAGLWFDAYIWNAEKKAESRVNREQKAKDAVLEEVTKLGESSLYPHYFTRWEADLPQRFTIQTVTPLALNLGMASVVENGVALHHTYGVPMLPGSSLKGLAAAYAHLRLADPRWHKAHTPENLPPVPTGVLHRALFGDGDEVGAVIFDDALPQPGKWRLRRDVVTVHHQDYYSGKNKAPADWDSPIPSPFLSVWGTFSISLRPVSQEYTHWVDIAWKILQEALTVEGLGLGAKTSSGYGRFEVVN